MSIERKKLKSGDSVFATGVFLTLKEDNTWAVMAFEDDTFHEGACVNGISAIATDNKPYIGDEEEEEIVDTDLKYGEGVTPYNLPDEIETDIDKLLNEDHQTIVDKVGNYLEFIGETDQKDDFLKIAWDTNNIPVEITKEMIALVVEDMDDFEDYVGCTTD